MSSEPANKYALQPGSFPVFYSFRRCPYAMRARLALKASRTTVRLREVVLRDKPPALLEASPKGTVPVLQLADGTVIEQSFEIMQWALQRNDPLGWLRTDELAEVTALVGINDGEFKQLLDRYKYAPRFPERAASEYRNDAVRLMLDPLNSRLERTRYLLRDTPSIADFAIVPFVRQFAAVDEKWFSDANLPKLAVWMKEITSSALFMSVMDKYAPWTPTDEDLLF